MSIYLSVCLSIDQSIYLSVCLSIDLSIYLSISLSRSVFLSIYLSTCLFASLKTLLFCETFSFFKVDNLKNEAILRDFLIFWSWQHQKRSNTARLPHFSKLTTSKTKQFCETSSCFELDNIQNEAILQDFLIFRNWQHQKPSISARLPSKMESWVQSWRPRTNAFCDFSTPPV